MRKKYLLFFAIIFLLILAAVMRFDDIKRLIKSKNSEYKIQYKKDEGVFQNPLTGFAPNTDYVELAEKYSLVYMNIIWSELEPEEGKYDWESIEAKNNLSKWKQQGKNLIIRFVCDLPTEEEHMDIPDWLYEKTGDGKFYDMEYGKGYCPDYNNEDFIEAHRIAIKEIGNHFSKDGFLAYVELGSLGHWGEWHTFYPAGIPKMPSSEVRREYVDAYVAAFPYAKLLMRRPFSELPDGAGVFNDMTGAKEDTEEFLEWIKIGGDYEETGEKNALKAVPEIWNIAPVGGEFTSSISMDNMLTANLGRTISLLEKTHMIFIGPHIPDIVGDDAGLTKTSNEILKHVGYRYMVSSMSMKKTDSDDIDITITMRNDGVCPIYFDYIPCIYIEKAAGSGNLRFELPIKLTELYQDCEASCTITVPGDALSEKGDRIYVGIENPDTHKASVYLTMKAERKGTLSLLYEK